MRILFMGTPDIAAECLKALYAAGHDICAVYTRRDKPVGRKQVLTAPPVKEVALAHGTPVFQPRTLRDGSEDENIRALAPELIVVVAYGCILPKSVLEMPRYGCINLHVSLLPKYRGSAPVQWSVLNGDAETGVSIMQMDEGLDTGDVLYCKKIAIDPEETSGELFDRVTAVGAEALCETIPQIAAGTLTAVPQDHENATLAPMLNKEMAEFHLTDTATHIHNWVRGMNPWPGAWFSTSGGKKLKVMSCRVATAHGEAPGTVLGTKPLTVACSEGAIQLLEVVPEGKKPMDGTAFAAGRRLKTGDSLCWPQIRVRRQSPHWYGRSRTVFPIWCWTQSSSARSWKAGIRLLQVPFSTLCWSIAARWTIFWSSFCPRGWQSWMPPCGRFCALHWHRHAICRCLSLLR